MANARTRAFGLFFIVTAAWFTSCDIPTQPPKFDFTTSIGAPLLLDQTYVLIGPGETGHAALIDTTKSDLDTLFTVGESDQTLFLNQELDAMEIGELDGVFGEIDLDPIDVDVSIGSLESQSFDAPSFDNLMGVFETVPISLGPSPVNFTIDNYPIGSVLVPPTVDLISLNGVSVESVQLSTNTGSVNRFTLTLDNGLPSGALTDGAGDAPEVVLERDSSGVIVESGRARFDAMPSPGQTTTAVLDVAGAKLTAGTYFRLVISTDEGNGPIDANPLAVTITTDVSPLEYVETGVSSIPAQPAIDASSSTMSLSGSSDFTGIIAAGGNITIALTNTLPMEITLTEITATNQQNVANFAAPSVMFDLNDLPPKTSRTIPAGETGNLVFPLAGAPISSEIQVTITASSPGIGSSGVIAETDGIVAQVTGTVEVDELFFTPDAESFLSTGQLEIDVDDVTFEHGDDYVALEGGVLMLESITNEMGLDLETLVFSLPDFRVAPYTPADSLVIRFQGTVEDADQRLFPQLTGGASFENKPIDLTNVRLYPSGNEATYHVNAVSEGGTPSSLRAADRIRATIAPQNLEIKGVSARMDPMAIELTEDVDGDLNLDVLDPLESEVMELGNLSSMEDLDLEGFEFNGTSLTFTITTNVGADVVFYAVMAGETDEGEYAFLAGRGENAVSSSDTLAQRFLMNGQPVDPENLIKFVIPGADNPPATNERTIVLGANNSTLDGFISALPTELRYSAKGVVQGADGSERVQLEKPFSLDAGLNIRVPLSFAGNLSFNKSMELDLSDLSEWTQDDQEQQLNSAGLVLRYVSGFPLGVEATVQVFDDNDNLVLALPDSTGGVWSVKSGLTDTAGLVTATTTDSLVFTLTKSDLETLSQGRRAEVNLSLMPNEGVPATFRATDSLRVGLHGRFDVTLNVENE